MAFAQFDQLIISNIFSYLSLTEVIPTKKAMEQAGKFPKCARKEFVDGLHPFYLFIWRLKDYYNGWVHHTDNVVYNAIAKKLPNEYVFYLIEKVKFKSTVYDLEPIFKSENFEMMKYYHQKGFMTSINLVPAAHFTQTGRLDILEWLYQNFEEHMKYHQIALIRKAVQSNQVEIAAFLQSKKARIARGYEFIFKNWLSAIECELEQELSPEMITWLWKNDYRWTREDAERIGNEEMKKFVED